MDGERDGLRADAKGVLKSDVAGLETIGIHFHYLTEEGPTGGRGAHVCGDDGGGGVSSGEGEVHFIAWDVDSFAVDAGTDLENSAG